MKEIIGQTIKEVRPMTDKEMEEMYWCGERPAVLVLSNGVRLFPSCDYEGNDGGAIFWKDKKGATYIMGVKEEAF